MRNTIYIIAILLLCSFAAQAQEPDTSIFQPDTAAAPKAAKPKAKQAAKDTLIVKAGRVITGVKEFRGWMKTESGWTSSMNRIPFADPDYNNEYYEKYELGAENIQNISVEEIRVNGKRYYGMFIEQKKGFYKDYANTDWRYYTAADFYLFEPAEFKKLLPDSFKFNKKYTANIRIAYAGLLGYKSIPLRNKYLAIEMNKTEKNKAYYDTTVKKYLQFALYPVNNKKGKHMRFNTSLAYANDGLQPEAADYSLFDTQFYEMPFERFKQFARPAKP